MDRTSAPGFVLDSRGKRVFSDGNPFTNPKTNGAILDSQVANGLVESILAVVEITGRTPDAADNTQLLESIRDLIVTGVQRKRLVYAGAKTGLATLDVIGMSAPTLVGTASFANTVRGPFLQLDTIDNATDRDAGVFGPYDAAERRWKPDWTFLLDTNTVSDSRLWIGLFSATPMALTSPATISCAGFRYENQVDTGATWRTLTSDGTNRTEKNTNSPIAINTTYELRVRNPSGGRFEFLINGVLVNAHDTAAGEYCPAAATALGPVVGLRHSVASGATKAIRFSYSNG